MKIVFLGGRQARDLCEIYKALSGSRDGVDWIEVSGALRPEHEPAVAAADKIAVQDRGTPPLDFEAIGAKGETIPFPEIALDFLWPFGGQPHLCNTQSPAIPDGPFPVELGDAWLNRRLSGRQMAQAIEADYLALDVAKAVDLDAYRILALDRQAQIDKACGADFASRLDEGFRAGPLFANPLAPGPDLMRDLVNGLLPKLGARISLTKDWRPGDRLLPELPIHPSVAAHFGLTWTQGRRYRSAAGETWDFSEYVRRYLAYSEGPELETGVRLVAEGRPLEALKPLEIAAARPMGRRSAAARQALTAAFLADPRAAEAAAVLRLVRAEGEKNELTEAADHFARRRWPEAEATALAHLEKSPNAVEVLVFLSFVREKRGDADGRIAALRAALNLRPRDVALQSRLTLALATKGDVAGAIRSAEVELILNPSNPHARAFLAHLLERAGERERAKEELAQTLAVISVGAEYGELRNLLTKRRVDLDKTPAPPA